MYTKQDVTKVMVRFRIQLKTIYSITMEKPESLKYSRSPFFILPLITESGKKEIHYMHFKTSANPGLISKNISEHESDITEWFHDITVNPDLCQDKCYPESDGLINFLESKMNYYISEKFTMIGMCAHGPGFYSYGFTTKFFEKKCLNMPNIEWSDYADKVIEEIKFNPPKLDENLYASLCLAHGLIYDFKVIEEN